MGNLFRTEKERFAERVFHCWLRSIRPVVSRYIINNRLHIDMDEAFRNIEIDFWLGKKLHNDRMRLVLEALTFTPESAPPDKKELQQIIDEIRHEYFRHGYLTDQVTDDPFILDIFYKPIDMEMYTRLMYAMDRLDSSQDSLYISSEGSEIYRDGYMSF